MNDLAAIPIERLIGVGLAVVVWAWIFFFCVNRARRVGAKYEEPVLPLYTSTFKGLRILAFFAFAGAGWFLPVALDPAEWLESMLIPLAMGFGATLVLCAAVLYCVRLYVKHKAEEEAVVIEETSLFQVILQGIVILAALILVGVAPFVAATALGLDPEELFLASDFGGALALILNFVGLWIVPYALAERLEQQERSAVWVRSPGLVLFRWAWLGLLVLAVLGVPAMMPGLSGVFAMPLPIWLGLTLGLLSIGFFGLWWAWPLKVLYSAEAEGDFVAKDRARGVRLWGLPAFLLYLRLKKKQAQEISEDSKLCPTCLRPIDQIQAYKNLKFDACPNCNSPISPVFSVNDYLAYQEETLVPLIQNGADGRKKSRGEADNQRVQELLKAMLAAALAQRGTDVHFVTENSKFIVRCRVDGVLYPMLEFEEVMSRPIINSLKVMANMDITERRKPQDGAFKIELLGRRLDVRVNTSPVGEGEMAAARLLYRSSVLGSIESLGMSARNAKLLTTLINRPNGLILVTGPTGSGKSTTLYNALETLSGGDRNIVTLEDPIEYQLKGVTQMQISAKKGFTFATGLRSILRQDPDVIMVGEIRDPDTAKMAVDAAATGHVVFSTLHSMDSVSAVQRLADLDIDVMRLATVILLVLAQRLVRLNCPHCGEERVLRREDLEALGIPGAPEEEFIVKVGTGCVYCRESGFYGREGIYEFFVPNQVARDLISRASTVASIRSSAREAGMRTMLEDGLTKVLLGKTTLEEVIRVSN